jgi:hypothetical protein
MVCLACCRRLQKPFIAILQSSFEKWGEVPVRGGHLRPIGLKSAPPTPLPFFQAVGIGVEMITVGLPASL